MAVRVMGQVKIEAAKENLAAVRLVTEEIEAEICEAVKFGRSQEMLSAYKRLQTARQLLRAAEVELERLL